ncbi:MAG: polysulfide reductase NrfD [Candidatus Velthaea sp.]
MANFRPAQHLVSERHGAAYSAATDLTPENVAASMGRGDGGFGRDQSGYYNLPVLKRAHWGWEVTVYFYLGGVGAGSALLATAAAAGGAPADRALVRTGRYTALAGAALSGLLLVMDLGRPERFLQMLRIAKLKSPMSVGVYSLLGFSGAAALACADQLHADGVVHVNAGGFVPRPVRGALLALTAGLMASYTGVLISATAIPVWYAGRRHIPAMFVCSAVSTACAFNSLLLMLSGGNAATIARLERIEAIAAAFEGALLLDYERRSGRPGHALFAGAIGTRLKRYTLGGGIAVPLALHLWGALRRRPVRGHALRTLLSAALTLAGGYVLRDSLIRAGRTSADDPAP